MASSVATATARQRLVAEGTIQTVGTRQWAGVAACACELDDGTGRVVLAFTGRSAVPGMVVGARCRVVGTCMPDPHGPHFVLWNPGYELLP
ncbi:MAG: hypothetical protein ACYDA2_04670 [Acidimicrobiales bacterium]